MMAVDTKQGTTNAPAGTPGPAATLAGIPALSANGQAKPRKRPSSLMAQASALPSVENSLDEFIAKANETLIDPSTFNSAAVKHEEDEKRKEHDALRWKATEQQMRESQAREESLRRQLDGLQGKLAEAEARAAVAGSGGSQDGIIADLKLRLTMADEKIRSSEERARINEGKVGKLEQDLVAAKSAAAAAPAARDSLVGIGDEDAEQRVRIAEAKAAKAIAAAKAASAGLTVSAADIAAIESGLAISTMEPAKKTPWGLVVAAFIVGGAIMFAVAFVTMKNDAKPATSAAGAQPAAAVEKQPEAAPVPAKVTATPIEDKAAAPVADDKAAAPAADDDKAATATDTAEDDSAEDKAADAKTGPDTAAKAAAADAAAAKAEKAAAAKAAAADAAAAKAEKAAAAKAAASKKAAPKKAAPKKASAIADPFGDTPAPAKKKKKDTGIVDPF
jgi:hypothetical protein